jgi:hypothetical protein
VEEGCAELSYDGFILNSHGIVITWGLLEVNIQSK